MVNEILFVAVALLDLTFVVVVARFGTPWLYGAITLNLLLISTFGAKLVTGFGYTSNIGNVFYAVVFFATQLLVERFGKREGYRSVLFGFCSILFFILMAQFVIAALGVRETEMVNQAIETLFQAVPRVALASILAYAASQITNIWLFDRLRTKTRTKHAYLRLNVSNLVGQFVDSILFFSIAFYGVLPRPVFLETLIVGFFLKVGIGALSTPFLYGSMLFGPKGENLERPATGARSPADERSPIDRFTRLAVFAVVTIPLFIMGILGYVNTRKTLTELAIAKHESLAYAPQNAALATLTTTYAFVLLVGLVLAFMLAQAIVKLRKSREILRKSEGRLSEAQAIAHVGNFEWDVNSNHVEWSDELYNIYGLNRNAFTATYETFLQKLHPDSREYVKSAIATALENGQTFEFEERIVRPNGEERILATRGDVVRDAAGKAMRVVGVCRDITAQKEVERKLQEDKAKDEALLDSIGEGVVALDNEGRVLFINAAAKRLLELSEQSVLGKPVVDILSLVNDQGGEVLKDELPFIKALKEGRTFTTAQYHYVRPGGARFPVGITAAPVVLDGKRVGIIEVFRDMSHEREVDKAKTEFVSLASHQLRTPLSVIKWYIEMLVAQGETLTEQQRQYLAEISRGNNRMINLVRALLDVSRLELGTFSVEPVETHVSELVKSVVHDHVAQIQKKRLSVTEQYDDLPMIRVDEQLMRIIVQNLFSNAIQYTPPGGRVLVSLTRKGEQLLFTVSDTGIGIPPHQQSRIFQKLFRADNARGMHTTGTGLGLYIVKAILDHVGGAVIFTSKEGEGTEFRVRLPLSGMSQKEGTKRLGN